MAEVEVIMMMKETKKNVMCADFTIVSKKTNNKEKKKE